jgi:FHS family L-fucose permease-like MFS transporter
MSQLMASNSVRVPDSTDTAKALAKTFASMCVLFFAWGLLATWNDLLIPRFRDEFHLNFLHAMFVQCGFYGGYALGAIAYYIQEWMSDSPAKGNRFKTGIVTGLWIAGAGALLFIPAAMVRSYPLFLTALLVIGVGFAIIQIAANPCVIALGAENTASSRLNLAAACSSVGTAIGPLIGGWIIFGSTRSASVPPLGSVRTPYLLCSMGFLFAGAAFLFLRMPQMSAPCARPRGPGVLAMPSVLLGVVAIFMYVGSEVTIGSSIINFLGLKEIGNLSHAQAGRFLSLYWGGLMGGRFMGAAALSSLPASRKKMIVLLLSLLMLAATVAFFGWRSGIFCGVCLLLIMLAFYLGRGSAGSTLLFFGATLVLLLAVVIFCKGSIAFWAVLGTGLFCSIMWSNIFSLVLQGLGPLQGQASSLLVMAISGAAVLPPLQGAVADRFGLHVSFWVPLLAMIYVTAYGLYHLRKNARNLEEVSEIALSNFVYRASRGH